MSKSKVKFISYDGTYPNLCRGTLKLEIDGKQYALENALVSGGCVYFDDDWKDYVSSGPWDIELDKYKELEPYKAEILKVVNKNVKFGCCGGCV